MLGRNRLLGVASAQGSLSTRFRHRSLGTPPCKDLIQVQKCSMSSRRWTFVDQLSGIIDLLGRQFPCPGRIPSPVPANSRCSSWKKNGARDSRFLSSATSDLILVKRFWTAGMSFRNSHYFGTQTSGTAFPTLRPMKPLRQRSFAWTTCARIFAKRRSAILPLLKRIRQGVPFRVFGAAAARVRWQAGESGDLVLAANLLADAVNGFPLASPSLIWLEGTTEDDGRFSSHRRWCGLSTRGPNNPPWQGWRFVPTSSTPFASISCVLSSFGERIGRLGTGKILVQATLKLTLSTSFRKYTLVSNRQHLWRW